MFRAKRLINSIINVIFTIAEIFLLFRFALKLFAANEAASFVQFIYDTSQPLLAPFEGIFPTVADSGAVIEFSTLCAILVYALLAYLLMALIDTVYEAGRTTQQK